MDKPEARSWRACRTIKRPFDKLRVDRGKYPSIHRRQPAKLKPRWEVHLASTIAIGYMCKVFLPPQASFRPAPESRIVRFRPTQSKAGTLDTGFRRYDGGAPANPCKCSIHLGFGLEATGRGTNNRRATQCCPPVFAAAPRVGAPTHPPTVWKHINTSAPPGSPADWWPPGTCCRPSRPPRRRA